MQSKVPHGDELRGRHPSFRDLKDVGSHFPQQKHSIEKYGTKPFMPQVRLQRSWPFLKVFLFEDGGKKSTFRISWFRSVDFFFPFPGMGYDRSNLSYLLVVLWVNREQTMWRKCAAWTALRPETPVFKLQGF